MGQRKGSDRERGQEPFLNFQDGRGGRPCPGRGLFVILDGLSPQEIPAVAKRKPPSQRSERQLDEAARAIARARDEAKAEKSDESQRDNATKPALSRLAKDVTSRKVSAPPAFPSTKRPKTG